MAFLVSAVVGLSLIASASAALPPPPVLDRNYRMGEGEGGVSGNTVTVTWDTQGSPGMQQLIDLSAVGGPKYEALPTVSGGPVPKRPDNGTGMAIRLNPTAPSQGQYLKTGFEQALNFPERSYSSTFQPGGTIDYSFIRDRGFQLWVLPTDRGAGRYRDGHQSARRTHQLQRQLRHALYQHGLRHRRGRGAQYLVPPDGHPAVRIGPRLDHVRQRQGRGPGLGHVRRRR